MTKGDRVWISPQGVVLKGTVLAADIDWDGEKMVLIRYDEDTPARRPYTLWPENDVQTDQL